jgi:hypothetical protein
MSIKQIKLRAHLREFLRLKTDAEVEHATEQATAVLHEWKAIRIKLAAFGIYGEHHFI